MNLILWRHAEAEDGMDDLARKLTLKGHKQAAKMAGWLNQHLPENCRVLSSPAVRAVETAQALGRSVRIVESIAPGASVQAILNIAAWPGNEDDCTLIAGHQPGLGAVAAFLLGANGPISVRKGAIWWFSSRMRHGVNEVVLRAVISPELLKET